MDGLIKYVKEIVPSMSRTRQDVATLVTTTEEVCC